MPRFMPQESMVLKLGKVSTIRECFSNVAGNSLRDLVELDGGTVLHDRGCYVCIGD